MSSAISLLADDLRAGAFSGRSAAVPGSRQIGAEAEFIPVESSSGCRCPIEGDGVIATLPFLRRFGSSRGWREGRTSKGTPCFTLPNGGTFTFEPGGQLEYSSPPCDSALVLLSLLRSVILPLRAAAAAEGIHLLATGIDPLNSIDDAPLLIRAKRYQCMADYLATRGPAGARMMRQTAAFQVSLDLGDDPWLRWRVLNATAPYAVAIFANSPIYQGKRTGYQSTRAAVWREVDPARTGIVYDETRPVEAYLDFALDAPAILFPAPEGEYRPFRDWVARVDPPLEQWHDHLSTLFPEVRPRGHLELRSIDALPPHWYAAPVALLSGLLYDPESLRAADDLLSRPDATLLDVAAHSGLHNPAVARTAADLFQISLAGCRRLGTTYFHPFDLEQATAFFDGYTRRGRAPADDVVERAIAA